MAKKKPDPSLVVQAKDCYDPTDYVMVHKDRYAKLVQERDDALSDYRRWHQAFLDAKYPDMLPTRVDLEAALEWAAQWVPNPVECSPVPPTEIVKIIHGYVIGSARTSGGVE